MNDNTLPENPLFNQGELPDFSAIQAEHVVPAVREAIRVGREKLKTLEQLQNPTWQAFVLPLRDISRRLDRIWGTVGHLLGVKNSDALRAAHEEVQPEVVEFQLSIGQNPALFKSWQALQAAGPKEITTAARKRIVEAAIRDARLSGVALEGEKQKRFNEIQRDLAALATKFSNAVLDATKAFQIVLTKPEEIAGLPQSWLAGAAHAAQAKGHAGATAENGPWLVTLDYPSYYPVLQHAQNRALREQVYRASVTRASSEKLNNWPVIDEILRLRHENAQILGFANYAQVSLAAKMAPETKNVREMIVNLGKVAKPQAQNEFVRLTEYAKQKGHEDSLQLWDIAFYSERRREELYSFTDEELRPYFPLPKVLSGMFDLAEKLFAVKIAAAPTQPKVWHRDVQYFDVYDTTAKKIAGFFLDPYARSGEKRGGAWMDVCRQREATEESLVLPVAYLVCNGTPPVGEKPSLMTFTEVETLFHEFGHGLQHMLTTVDEYEASGISNVEWDAVELPSQFMENWVYERSVIDQISGHVETGEPLPQPLFEKIIAAKNYMAGSILLRQLYFSLLDLELHEVHGGTLVGVAKDGGKPTEVHGGTLVGDAKDGGKPTEVHGETVRDVQRRIAAEYTVIPPLPEDAFLCSFSHIFAGGYAAGYYSYKWAEVLSADAFAAFEEAGLNDDAAIRELGRRYRETVLARGGSEHPLEVYRAFRGRDATIDALLRHNGLIQAA